MQPRWHEPSKTAEGELLQHVLQLEQIVKGRMAKNMNCMNCSDDSCPSCSKKASKAGEMDRKGEFKPNRGDEKQPTLKGRGGMLSNFDFSKNTDKGMPLGLNGGGQRMTQDEASGGAENQRMGQPYTVDQRVFDMASRKRYTDTEDTDAEGKKIYGTGEAVPNSRNSLTGKNRRKITRTPRPGPGQRSDFDTEGDGSSVMAPKPDWMGKADITSQFLASKGVIVKYEQEGSVENGVPQFMDHSGGTPIEARPYQTNGTYPDFNEVAPKKAAISEVAKMPAYAKTGYDEKGSSVHMHLTDGGDRKDGNWNMAPIEESLTQLRKGYGNPGIIEEIASLMENVAKNL